MNKQKILDIIRYILFIPIAFIAAIIAGVFGNWLGNFGVWIYKGSEILGWIFSGVASAIAYIHIATLIAPKKTNIIKWIVLGTLIFLGLFSSITGFFFSDSLSFIAGVVMTGTAFVFIKLKPDEMNF